MIDLSTLKTDSVVLLKNGDRSFVESITKDKITDDYLVKYRGNTSTFPYSNNGIRGSHCLKFTDNGIVKCYYNLHEDQSMSIVEIL